MEKEVKPVVIIPKHHSFKIALVIILVGLAIFGGGWIINYKSRQNIKLTPSSSPSSSQTVISHALDTCSVTKVGNPLVESVSNQNDKVEGVYKGKITSLTPDPVLKSTLITLTSLDNQQSYKFMIRNEIKSDLKINQILSLSFICDKKSSGFKITKVSIFDK